MLGGPIGALLGFVMGSYFDSGSKAKSSTQGNFAVSLIVLVAAVMKADDKILRSELNYVKQFFNQNFGYEKANEAIMLLRDVLKQDIPVEDVCQQIRRNMNYSERLQLLHFLFGISKADGAVAESERLVIENISHLLGIDEKDFVSIKSMFIKDINSAYKILEIEPGAGVSEIKKAYRRMAVKYHPDKVSHLGKDFQKAAKEKFQKVNEAYESLKAEKQFN